MRAVNGDHTQAINHRQGRIGHVVGDSINARDPYTDAPRAGFLGNEAFVSQRLDRFSPEKVSAEIPRRHRPARGLTQIAARATDRDLGQGARQICYGTIYDSLMRWLSWF